MRTPEQLGAKRQRDPSPESLNPIISVILPVHNGERFLAEAIESVLGQTFSDIELIIVENASSDGSLGIAESYATRDARIKVLRSDKAGASGALNLGTSVARGCWFARMDADDIWLPEKLKRQWQFIQDTPGVDVVGSWAWKITESGRRIGMFQAGPTTEQEFLRLREDNEIIYLVSPSVMFSRNAVNSVGGHDPSYVRAQDVEYWTRIADRFTVLVLPEPLLLYRVHATSASTGSILRQNTDAVRVKENIKRRRTGLAVLTHEEFVLLRSRRPVHKKVRERMSWQSQYYYRLGGGLLGDGEVQGVAWLMLAFALNPALVAHRLYNKCIIMIVAFLK